MPKNNGNTTVFDTPSKVRKRSLEDEYNHVVVTYLFPRFSGNAKRAKETNIYWLSKTLQFPRISETSFENEHVTQNTEAEHAKYRRLWEFDDDVSTHSMFHNSHKPSVQKKHEMSIAQQTTEDLEVKAEPSATVNAPKVQNAPYEHQYVARVDVIVPPRGSFLSNARNAETWSHELIKAAQQQKRVDTTEQDLVGTVPPRSDPNPKQGLTTISNQETIQVPGVQIGLLNFERSYSNNRSC